MNDPAPDRPPTRRQVADEINHLLDALEQLAPGSIPAADIRRDLAAFADDATLMSATGPTGGLRSFAFGPARPASPPAPPTLTPIGTVESDLLDIAAAPKQGTEGAPDAWLSIQPQFGEGLLGLQVGDALVVLTWLDQGDRDVLQVHPRDNPENPLTGVFRTRSADRPNPIGLHTVTLHEIRGTRLRVGPLEAVDGTPILDLKPVL